MAQEFLWTCVDHSFFDDIIRFIPREELLKMNDNMHGPFWLDWEWCFECPLTQYDSRRLYYIFNKRHVLGLVLNSRWVSNDKESHLIYRLHSVFSPRGWYKLHVFALLMIYQGLPMQSRFPKSGLFDDRCIVFQKVE